MKSLTSFYTVYQNVFVLYSPMMATYVAETCSCSYCYNICWVDGLYVGFISL